ncbi:thioredoxin-domain-containing protein [Dendrothele bispora CBS 962.96]|uniref:Thioredoxin-domain-containing protein n=1 Tax=Dendrothele bispora (strain CBS 962.96) TaxID=1314807 RepID=A0A4S8MDK4_DENBC|nr:thioredoxin-domain-containing protein [Dendrothele bispora CBS 962.96]
MISPVFEKLASSTSGLGFYKVDVDEQSDISQECGISAMPTFMLFHKGNKIDECKGAIPPNLQKLVTHGASLVTGSAEANTEDGGKHTDSVTESSTVAAAGADDGGAAAAAAASF